MADNNVRNLTANFTADTSGFSPKINELVQKLKLANQEFEQNKVKLSALKTEMKSYQKELTELEKKQREGGTLTAEETRRMQELRDKIANCATQIGTYNSAQRQLTADINSTNRQLSEMRDGFNGTGQAAATFGDILKANIASDVILGAIRKITNGLRQAAAYCYDVGSKFEAGMSKVAAVSGASADELEQLTAKAKELGATTKFTASETAEAMNYMAMAGWKTEDMLNGIDGVLNAAAASGTDLATTSDIITDALTAFGLKAEDCAHFADLLAAASSNANTNVEMMGETFQYCAPIAGALGFKAEDVAVGIGLMANAGVKASNAGTAMRKFMTELSEGLTITGEKIGEVTIKTSNADGTMRSFSDILQELRDTFSQLTDAEKSAAAKDIVGQNALSGFLAMMNASESDVQKLSAAIQNCDGAAGDMAQTMQDNVPGAVTEMNSALESVGNAVYEKFKGGLLDAVNIFTEALTGLKDGIDGGELDQTISELSDSFKELATSAADFVKNNLNGFIKGVTNVINFIAKFRTEIASAITSFVAFKSAMKIGSLVTSLVSAFKNVAGAIKGAATAQEALNTVMSTGNPILTVISATLGAVTFALAEFIGHSGAAGESVKELRNEIDELSRSTEEYKNKSDSLADIKQKYEDIYNSEKPAAEKADELKNLQAQLIEQFPELKNQIDLTRDAYDGMSAAMDGYIAKNEKLALAKLNQAKAKAEELQSGTVTLKDTDMVYISDESMEYINQNIANAQADRASIEISGTYEEKIAALEKLHDYYVNVLNEDESDSRIEAINKAWEEATKDLENYQQILSDIDDLNKSESANAENSAKDWSAEAHRRLTEEAEAQKEQQQKTTEKNQKAYDEEVKMLDAKYNAGYLIAQEYYAKLKELRDKYLTENTVEWYDSTAKLNGILGKSVKSYSSTTQNALSETEMAYKKTLAAIDAEIEKHNRAKSDKEYEQKLADIDEQMKYGRLDDFEKFELEKERKKLQEERNEELFSRNAADAKSSVTNAYNAKQTLEKASENTKEYTMALGDYTDALKDLSGVLKGVSEAFGVNTSSSQSVSNIDDSTTNQYVNVVLQAVNKSNGQLVDELIKALHNGL